MATADACSSSKAPTQAHEISVYAQELLSDLPQRSWTIHIENNVTGARSSQFKLFDPFSVAQYDELRWYMENFAVQDPFAIDRAMRIAESLNTYGDHLVMNLQPAIDEIMSIQEPKNSKPSWGAIHFLVFGNGTINSLHALRWELIERAEFYHSAVAISVSRLPNRSSRSLGDWKPSMDRPIHILYVSARPGLEEDISYRAISRQIWDLMEIVNKHDPQVKMDFVRPGTWNRFNTMLESRGPAYYDVVHFDMHGTVSKRIGIDTAFLHFSTQGAASTKSDPRSARQIGKQLVRSKITAVVLNACNAATAGSSEESNLANIMASQGVKFVLAMAYKVKTDAAGLIMRKFYSTLFAERRNYVKAVRCARVELRKDRKRTARYGMTVECDDDCNLVCYLANLSSGLTRCTDGFELVDMLSQAPIPLDTPLKTVLDRGISEQIDALNIVRIQDLDILSVEELLLGNDTIFISGESGTGKSTLARHMRLWWMQTHFARSIEYFDTSQDTANWLDDNYTAKSLENRSAEGIVNEIAEPLGENDVYDYNQIIILDNIESWETFHGNAARKEISFDQLDLLKRIQEGSGKCRVLVFTRMTEESLTSRWPDKIIHEISIPTVEEAMAVGAHYLSEQTPTDQEGAAELEELIQHHRMNLSFLHVFVPRMAQLEIRAKNFIASLLDSPQACDFSSFHDYIDTTHSPSAFRLIRDRIQAWSQEAVLSFRMNFTFCMFQRRIPQDVRFWLDKLYEKGLFSGGKPTMDPFPIESGKIHCYDLDEGWASFPSDWNFEHSWAQVKECFELGGLIQNEEVRWGEGEPYFRAHPLLPYFLRYEIARLPLRDVQKYWSHLRNAYWEYYEVRANSLTLSWLRSPDERYSIMMNINNDIINLKQAVKLSAEQTCFPFRVMRVYNLIPYLNFSSMSPVKLRHWASLLDHIFTRFERICFEKEWSDAQPQDFKQSMMLYAIQVAECLGKIFGELGSNKAVTNNAERALSLKDSFIRDFLFTTNNAIDSVIYIIQVQYAKAVLDGSWSSKDLELFEDLLLSGIPDGLQASGGRMRVAKAELANYLANEKKHIPEGHPLHAMTEAAFQEGITFIQSIFLESGTLSQHLSLEGRSAITYPTNQKSDNSKSILEEYNSEQNVLQTYRNIQKEFLKRTPYNNPGYSADARTYTVDTQAISRKDKFIFDRTRLRQVYEIAQQQKDVENQVFCVRHLSAAAMIDGDLGAAESYLKVWDELEGQSINSEQLPDGELSSRKEGRKLLLAMLQNQKAMKNQE